jgi:hypothetical protein
VLRCHCSGGLEGCHKTIRCRSMIVQRAGYIQDILRTRHDGGLYAVGVVEPSLYHAAFQCRSNSMCLTSLPCLHGVVAQRYQNLFIAIRDFFEVRRRLPSNISGDR